MVLPQGHALHGVGRELGGKGVGKAGAHAPGVGTSLYEDNLRRWPAHCTKSPQKGLFWRSSPMLLDGPCPG